jgi:hypothetical protein
MKKQRGGIGTGPGCGLKSGFPMSLQNQNEHKLTVKTARGASNGSHESREGQFLYLEGPFL